MSIRTISAGLALATAALVMNASAATTIHGASCQAQDPNNREIVTNHFQGCTVSVNSGWVAVVLPAVRINQGTAQAMYVDYVNTKTSMEALICSAYLIPFDGGPPIWSLTRSQLCDRAETLNFQVPADAWGYLSVACSLPRNCRLTGLGLDPG